MQRMYSKIIFATVGIIVMIGAVWYAIAPHMFRRQTIMEQIYPQCTTGITANNPEQACAYQAGIVNIFLCWGDQVPKNIVPHVNTHNSILMITWEPYEKKDVTKNILPFIARGDYDDSITQFARELATYDVPILLRWGHEMNGNWYPWSGSNSAQNPLWYQKAYRRIHDIFEREKVTNVRFVWSVNHRDVPRTQWNHFERYYPGNAFVDVIGIDLYNWGKGVHGRQRTQFLGVRRLLQNSYERVVHTYPTKPIIITEVGCASSGGNKKEWVIQFLDALRTHYRAVKGYVWFDSNKEADWSISDNKDTWYAYQQKTADPYFCHDRTRCTWLFRKRGTYEQYRTTRKN